jgi:type I restriction enzyme R subunit
VHFDEDPAFYARMSEKLERLIQEHGKNWQVLANEYQKLRDEAVAGRVDAKEGLTKEETTFYDFATQLVYPDGVIPLEDHEPLKKLLQRIVSLLQDTIGVIDFWDKAIEVKKLRGNLDTEILIANIPALVEKHERVAIEIIKLAEKRHKELTA